MTRPRRAGLALLLAIPAALGVALGVAGLTNLVDGRGGRAAALIALGCLLVAGSMRAVRSINARDQED